MVMQYLDEALFKIGGLPPLPAGATEMFVQKSCTLSNGLEVTVYLTKKANEVVVESFFPTAGPGVVTIQEMIELMEKGVLPAVK